MCDIVTCPLQYLLRPKAVVALSLTSLACTLYGLAYSMDSNWHIRVGSVGRGAGVRF